MSLLFNAEGYFCEGEMSKNWQFDMELGRIILTDKNISLIKKSNISLTEIGPNFDKLNELYRIPLLKISKITQVKKGKIYAVLIETTDAYLFSITLAGYKKSGKNESTELRELINTHILRSF
jgi:hypothetical protein